MKRFKHPLNLVLAFSLLTGLVLTGLTSCTPTGPAGAAGQPEDRPRERIERSDREYRERRDKDEDRDRVISRYKERDRRGADCEGDDDCEELCDDIYDRKRDKDDCEELSARNVELLAEIYEILEDPDEDSLEDMDLEAFEALINISIEPLDDVVGDYSRREAKVMLAWIAGDSEAAEIFEKEDDDFKVFKMLLDEIDDDHVKALYGSIDGSDNFMEIMVEAGNEEAGEWIHEFMDYFCEKVHREGVDDAKCLRTYCGIARHMNDNDAADLTDFEYFERYLDGVIEDGTNIDKWPENKDASGSDSDDRFEDAGDLSDEWWEDLCGSVSVSGRTHAHNACDTKTC